MKLGVDARIIDRVDGSWWIVGEIYAKQENGVWKVFVLLIDNAEVADDRIECMNDVLRELGDGRRYGLLSN